MTEEHKRQLKDEFERNVTRHSGTLKALNFVAAYSAATNELLIQKGIITEDENEQLQQEAQEYAQQEYENEIAQVREELNRILDEEFKEFERGND